MCVRYCNTFLSNPSLPPSRPEDTGEITATFTPTSDMEGYFTFTVKVEDNTEGTVNSDTAEVKVVVITEDDQIVLTFNNPASEIDAKLDVVSGQGCQAGRAARQAGRAARRLWDKKLLIKSALLVGGDGGGGQEKGFFSL